MFKPKLFTTLKDYNRQTFLSDLSSGVIVGIVALPLCIAFAIASGVSPEKGLITGIIGGLLISLLGGSRVQIGGPAGAFVVIVYGIVQQYGIEGLFIATFMAGILLIVMGLVDLGSMIKFIPHPVITGFTSGIAVIIFSSQVKDFFGLEMANVPAHFVAKWIAFAEAIDKVNPYAIAISAGTIVLMMIWPKVTKKIPGSLIALIAATILTQIYQWPLETIGKRFGEIASMIPAPVLPHLSFEVIRNMVQPAITIALLVAIESLLCAVVADGMIGGRHRSNMELVAQGFANMASSIFGGIPATGAIARTATNVRNGGRTPVAGIVHALTLLLIMLFFGKWASLIPLSCLAAILVVVAYNMFEWRSFVAILRSPKEDLAILLTTFVLTVVIDLTVAIEVGMVLAAFTFMKQMSATTSVSVMTRDMAEEVENTPIHLLAKEQIPKGVEIFEINGPLFFGAVYKFKETMAIVSKKSKVQMLRMSMVNAIDSTGLHALEEVYHDCKKHGIVFIISEIHAQPYLALRKAGLLAQFGEENVLATFEEAIQRARIITKS